MRHASAARRSRRIIRSGSAVAALAAVITVGGSGLAQARITTHHKTTKPKVHFSISSRPWGSVAGEPVSLYTLSNGRMSVKISNFGAIVQSIYAPDARGRKADVTLGFNSLAGYEANDAPQPSGGSGTTYFGATIGRYANRIANGQFTLDGVTYHLPLNNGPNTLHGGTNAWNMQVWSAAAPVKTANNVSVAMTYTSPDGQDGFPGTVVATVTFTVTRANGLRISYHATTDKPTVINMTNHSYFNLTGQASGSILGERLMINANTFTPTNATLIPTGAIDPVAGTPMDFRQMKPIGRDITSSFQQLVLAHGYDHNWVINGGGTTGKLVLAAKAEDPVSGRTLTAYSDQPGVQMYTGNFLVGDLVGTTGRTYRQSAGFTLETQHFPDSPNQPSFPTTTLNPGTPFDSTTVFDFGTVK